jgi:hypothetical protein
MSENDTWFSLRYSFKYMRTHVSTGGTYAYLGAARNGFALKAGFTNDGDDARGLAGPVRLF